MSWWSVSAQEILVCFLLCFMKDRFVTVTMAPGSYSDLTRAFMKLIFSNRCRHTITDTNSVCLAQSED